MTRSILVALSTTHHGFLRGIARYAHDHGWHIDATLAYTGKVPQRWSGDGVISQCGFSDELAEHVNSLGLPTVEITSVNQRVHAARIDTDYGAFGVAAAEYFLARRFKHFAVAPLADDAFHAQRLLGFSERLARAGHSVAHLPPLIADLSSHAIDWASRVREINARLNELPKPIAVFAYNDAVGVDIIKACLDIGLLVPEQVAVMGVDNDELLCEVSRVPLSSVRFDLAELAYQGAAFLDEILDGQSHERHRVVPAGSGITTRLSSEIFAMDNVHVAKACLFITHHLTDPNLSVTAIAAHAGLGERGMLKAFTKHVGRTMQEEISLLRHEKVCELLRTSVRSIKEIAAATGFSSGNYLTRAFRHRHQMTPEQYRRQDAGRSPQVR
jgi:LacI family transcriptional regulator